MVIVQFPSTDSQPSYEQLLAENQQLRERVRQQDIQIQRYRERLNERDQSKAVRQLPATVAGPATKIVIETLTEEKKRWEAQGKDGPQNYSVGILAQSTGMDIRSVKKALAEVESLGLAEVRETTSGEGTQKRYHTTLEFTEKIEEDPKTWERPEPRSANGRRCSCDAKQIPRVTMQKVIVNRATVELVCSGCGVTSQTRHSHRGKGKPVNGEVARAYHFDTEAHAMEFAKHGDLTGRIEPAVAGPATATDAQPEPEDLAGGFDFEGVEATEDPDDYLAGPLQDLQRRYINGTPTYKGSRSTFCNADEFDG